MSIDLSRALPYLAPAQSVEETAPLYAYGSADAPVTRAFSDTLIVQYMIDEPGALVFVRARDVGSGGQDALHARALDNLRAYTTRRKLRFEARDEVHLARLDGQHEASLLLLDELWDAPTRIADPIGELVAAVPERTALLFTGTARRHPGAAASALEPQPLPRAVRPPEPCLGAVRRVTPCLADASASTTHAHTVIQRTGS
jgi:hypothetical protein